MKINRIYLDGFRNYEKAEVSFDPRLNLVYGDNAQGKSNLLEAISYLGMASSFRGARENEIIGHAQDYFYIKGDIIGEQDGTITMEAAADRKGKRKWKLNGEQITRLADIIGVFHTVIFAPEDIWLVKAGPDQRRRYLNRQLSQNKKTYCRDQLMYQHILRQRNACLKNAEDGKVPDSLPVWDKQLVQTGSRIILERRRAVARLQELAYEIHGSLAHGEEIALRYLSSLKTEETEPAAIEAFFAKELLRLRTPELIRGMTLVGPHRDDMGIFINGHPAKEFGSQGQQRTAALSCKLAELELAREAKGEYPVLLLDDVMSELDEERRRSILKKARECTQTFITAVTPEIAKLPGKRFHIVSGTVIRQE